MYNSTKKCLTEQNPLENQLDRMFFLAAEEKMLPKIIYDYSYFNDPNRHEDAIQKDDVCFWVMYVGFG